MKKYNAANAECQALRYEANIEECRAAAKDRYNRDPKRVRAWFLKTIYGLTYKEYTDKIVVQLGLCAICQQPMEKVCVDHDHEPGEVRGLLCTQCNVMLGMSKDNTDTLARAIAYLNRYKKESTVTC